MSKALELVNVNKSYVNKSIFGKSSAAHILKNITLAIEEGTTLGLVGESGSGKTTTAKLVLKQEEVSGGTIYFHGKDISRLHKKEEADYRSQVKVVFQDPYSSLDPSMKIKDIIAEPLVISNAFTKSEIQEKLIKVMSQVGLAADYLKRYPREFSGGQRQRIAIARALVGSPKLLILDEPVSALDVSIRGQILNLLKYCQQVYKTTCLFISHDMASVGFLSDTIAVMYFGYIVEYGDSYSVLEKYCHPYTELLVRSNMTSELEWNEKEEQAVTEPPSHLNPPRGCPFQARCPYAGQICREKIPTLREINAKHFAACHFAGELELKRYKKGLKKITEMEYTI